MTRMLLLNILPILFSLKSVSQISKEVKFEMFKKSFVSKSTGQPYSVVTILRNDGSSRELAVQAINLGSHKRGIKKKR